MASTMIEKTLPSMLNDLDQFINNKVNEFSVGDQLTIADLELYHLIGYLRRGSYGGTSEEFDKFGPLDPIPNDICEPYTNLTRIYGMINTHPLVQDYEARLYFKEPASE
jgi:glutathione S-transferase